MAINITIREIKTLTPDNYYPIIDSGLLKLKTAINIPIKDFIEVKGGEGLIWREMGDAMLNSRASLVSPAVFPCQKYDVYRFKLISSPNNSSTVVMIFEFA